jgi:hypothetical protein
MTSAGLAFPQGETAPRAVGGNSLEGRPVTRRVTAEKGLTHWSFGPVTCVTCLTTFEAILIPFRRAITRCALPRPKNGLSTLTGEVARLSWVSGLRVA